MIKDSINNYLKYDLDKKIQKGLDYIASTDFSKLDDGKYVLSDDMYVNIQTYNTKDDADFEAHRIYADIQYIISGLEKIGVTEYSSCTTSVEYDANADIEFLKGEGSFIQMNKNDFMILYPEDAHKPSISINNSGMVRKAVVKVKL